MVLKLKGLVLPVVAGLLLGAAWPAAAQTSGGDCAGLADLRLDETNLHSASVVPAAGGLPEYCRVLGTVQPAINFEIRLPVRDWNGKFYMAGCGGFCGQVLPDRNNSINAMNHGLRRNYAATTMDAGHSGTSSVDGRWGWNNRPAEIDFGYRAVHETARVSKAVIRAYYATPERAPARSYFDGCSTGGRLAVMAATRYPEDFDGIISGAPPLDYPRLLGIFFTWLAQANTGPDGRPILTLDRVGLVRDAVIQACDGRDGLTDGLIDDPRLCDWQPRTLLCQGNDSTTCLTEAEVGTLERWYGGARNSRGEPLYPGGLPRGSEPFWPAWLFNPATNETIPPVHTFARDFLRYLAFAEDPGDSYSVGQFNFDQDPPRLRDMQEIYNPAQPDPQDPSRVVPNLEAFRNRGGRLLMHHSWADPLATPWMTLDYYEDVQRTMGGRPATEAFYRLFMVPAMDHCGIQPGPGIVDTGIDPLTALEAWVERGQAPTVLIATKRDQSGAPLWTRPVCQYPQVARYSGQGAMTDAANFRCVEP